MSINPIHVSDHAILRYLEQAHGLDIEAVRAHLAGLVVNGVRLEAAGVAVEGVKLVLRGPSVVTVVRRDWPSRRPEDGRP